MCRFIEFWTADDNGIHPFAMLYEDLTGEKELGDIEG